MSFGYAIHLRGPVSTAPVNDDHAPRFSTNRSMMLTLRAIDWPLIRHSIYSRPSQL
jgi:hypothetical protein